MECSIIIPYYNRIQYLMNTLRYLEQQDFNKDEYEVIVIDDGSDKRLDDKDLIVNSNMNFKYFYFDRSIDSGASFARNRGIELSQGKVLIFLDCDQIVNKDFVREHWTTFKNLEDGNNILQIGLRKNLKTDSLDFNKISILEELEYEPDLRYKIFEIFSFNMSLLSSGWRIVYSHNFSITKNLIQEVGGFDENYHGWGWEDIDLAYRLSKKGTKIVYNPWVEVFHLYHYDEWNEEKNDQWKKNLQYFINKFNEIPVSLNNIFDFYSIENENTKTSSNRNNYESWTDEWLMRYIKFENSINYLQSNRFLDDGNIFLIKPDLETIKSAIRRNQDRIINVICLKEDKEIIRTIQIDSSFKLVRLLIV